MVVVVKSKQQQNKSWQPHQKSNQHNLLVEYRISSYYNFCVWPRKKIKQNIPLFRNSLIQKIEKNNTEQNPNQTYHHHCLFGLPKIKSEYKLVTINQTDKEYSVLCILDSVFVFLFPKKQQILWSSSTTIIMMTTSDFSGSKSSLVVCVVVVDCQEYSCN